MTGEGMTKDLAGQLREASLKALEAVAAEHGLTVEIRGGKYDPHTGTYEPKVTFARADAAAKKFALYASRYGLSADDYGKTFTSGGKTFTITGIRPRATTRPISARGEEGREYVFPAEIVTRGLAAQR